MTVNGKSYTIIKLLENAEDGQSVLEEKQK